MTTSNRTLTRYGFETCVGGFFQMSTANAREILPAHLEPIEAQHTRSVLAVLAFRFTESEVGAYDELVMAIITPPLVAAGQQLPKAAFFPFMVATSTAAARQHAIERWHLPHHPADVDFDFEEDANSMYVVASEGGVDIVELTVTGHVFAPAVNPYHVFTVDPATGQPYKVDILMEAPHAEHEAEDGSIVLHDHPALARLDTAEVDPRPFREEWYRAGRQTFEELEEL